MSTARDLWITVMELDPGRAVGRGVLSLALAGAEVIDLLDLGAIRLDGDRLVPADDPTPWDALLQQAHAALVRHEPYESLDDWLWRRGRALADGYEAALESDGDLSRTHRRRLPFGGGGELVLTDSLAHRRAQERRKAGDPVLTALVAAVGLAAEPAAEAPDPTDDTATVLAAVGDAELELEGERQRRSVEEAAFDNIWRGA
ncbi:GPP34 family phosphoprotein [Streptomyces sp. NPDC057027]|uniref:GOLPH3/VPS74 family protein n=1 Tax=Streptomyces sp. NPDC057027 TaxID=3346004 RepID=UPI003626A2C9